MASTIEPPTIMNGVLVVNPANKSLVGPAPWTVFPPSWDSESPVKATSTVTVNGEQAALVAVGLASAVVAASVAPSVGPPITTLAGPVEPPISDAHATLGHLGMPVVFDDVRYFAPCGCFFYMSCSYVSSFAFFSCTLNMSFIEAACAHTWRCHGEQDSVSWSAGERHKRQNQGKCITSSCWYLLTLSYCPTCCLILNVLTSCLMLQTKPKARGTTQSPSGFRMNKVRC
jgi:hypothetical protein